MSDTLTFYSRARISFPFVGQQRAAQSSSRTNSSLLLRGLEDYQVHISFLSFLVAVDMKYRVIEVQAFSLESRSFGMAHVYSIRIKENEWLFILCVAELSFCQRWRNEFLVFE